MNANEILRKELNVKKIFVYLNGLNPKQTIISSLGRHISDQDWELAYSLRDNIAKYLPENTLAAKIMSERKMDGFFTDKQIWVIAYELMKNEDFLNELAEWMRPILVKEMKAKENEKENRKKRNAAIKAWKEKKAAQAAKANSEKAQEEPEKELNGIKKGDMVKHKKFGTGMVMEVQEGAFKVNFPMFGPKVVAQDWVTKE